MKNTEQEPKPNTSGISEKAFKRMILFFFIYASLFCIGVIVAVNLDKA
ncbi:hypothetical protein [Acinetobacter sp. MD2]|nr:hypothetical protein [Acinetobacter sp. MD2]MEB3766428.1 hypothetical protein [Acinetobacter sp. MD2]